MNHYNQLRKIIVSSAKNICVAGFVPFKDEPDIIPLLLDLLALNITVALPVVETCNTPLAFKRWQGEELNQKDLVNCFVPHTETVVIPDIILTPLQGFDEHGYRIGRGGGYYDRTINTLRKEKNILIIGIGFEHQRLISNAPKPHDARLDVLVTESNVYYFSHSSRSFISH